MDKILEFINQKTNNKYQNLLFFEAIYYSKNNTMQIIFKNQEKSTTMPENINELEVLCRQFLGSLVCSLKIYFKSDNFSLLEFKDFVKQSVSNCENLIGVDTNNIVFDFDKIGANVTINYIENNLLINNLETIKHNLEKNIFEYTNIKVKLNFNPIKNVQDDVLQLRKERIVEDNKIFEQIKQSQTVNFEVVKEIYNNVSNTTGLVAGSDIGIGNVIVVGKVVSVVERTKKSENEDVIQSNQSKYLTIEIENDGLKTSGVLFLKKDDELPEIKVDDIVAIEGAVNEFRGSKNIRIKNIVLCKYEQPKQIWRSKPTTYRFIKPEPYQFFEQANFFMVEEETKCDYLKNNTFVVYDLETTGINPDTNDIIDIGAFKIVNGKIVEKFATFINPMREIPEEASKINHITNSMVENSPTIEQVLPDFYNFCYGSIIVGYNNIGFDDLFIKKEGKKQLYNFDNKRDDVMLLAKKHIKGIKNYKLGTVCNYLNVQLIDAHRATNDALATAKVFIKIAEKFI